MIAQVNSQIPAPELDQIEAVETTIDLDDGLFVTKNEEVYEISMNNPYISFELLLNVKEDSDLLATVKRDLKKTQQVCKVDKPDLFFCIQKIIDTLEQEKDNLPTFNEQVCSEGAEPYELLLKGEPLTIISSHFVRPKIEEVEIYLDDFDLP